MIQPPLGTECAVSIMLKKDASKSFLQMHLSDFPSDDIDTCWLFSTEYSSDIPAINDVSELVKLIQPSLPIDTDYVENYNPIYVPSKIEADDIEFDEDGDIIGVGGFNNPFLICEIMLKLEEDVLVKGKVIYDEFFLPDLSASVLLNDITNESKIN